MTTTESDISHELVLKFANDQTLSGGEIGFMTNHNLLVRLADPAGWALSPRGLSFLRTLPRATHNPQHREPDPIEHAPAYWGLDRNSDLYAAKPATALDKPTAAALDKRAAALDKPATALDKQSGGDHYKAFKIQPVEFIEANKLSFLEGCVIKRMCRHGAKAKADDLRKAIHEIELLLQLRYGEKP